MEEKQKKSNFTRRQANLLLAGTAAAGAAPILLSTATSPTIYTDVFAMFAVYLAAIATGGTWLTRHYEGKEQQLVAERDSELSRIASKYNQKVNTLVELYNEELSPQDVWTAWASPRVT